MRALIILAAVVLLLALVGWITFSNGPDRSSINIETQEIKQNTRDVMEKSSELLKDAEGAIGRSNSPRGSEPASRQPSDLTPTKEPAPN